MSKKTAKASTGLVDKTKAHELNMAVLRRIDPETEEVRAARRDATGLSVRRRASALARSGRRAHARDAVPPIFGASGAE